MLFASRLSGVFWILVHFTYFSGVANTSLPAPESMQDDVAASQATTTESGIQPKRKTSVSLPEMLREVTVEEFLQAIERVQETQLVDNNSEMESNDEMTDSSDTREII